MIDRLVGMCIYEKWPEVLNLVGCLFLMSHNGHTYQIGSALNSISFAHCSDSSHMYASFSTSISLHPTTTLRVLSTRVIYLSLFSTCRKIFFDALHSIQWTSKQCVVEHRSMVCNPWLYQIIKRQSKQASERDEFRLYIFVYISVYETVYFHNATLQH